MRKKDYELIAEAFMNYWACLENGWVDGSVSAFGEMLADFLGKNPKFNKDKFLQECGIERLNNS